MDRVRLTLIRGICQLPAYVAQENGYFRQLGLEMDVEIISTASQVPDRFASGECDFAILPWTRVILAQARGEPLVLLSGSGCEEAAIVVRAGLAVGEVRTVALPRRGGLKDLTASTLFESLGWRDVKEMRMPSGDAAVLAFVSGAADAVSTVEPFATALEGLGLGTIVRRTGDIWPGAPGCSLTTTATLVETAPDVVRSVVEGFVCGLELVEREPDEAALIGARYIGVAPVYVREALNRNRPDADTLRNREVISAMLARLIEAGYLERPPSAPAELRFLDEVRAKRQGSQRSAVCCPQGTSVP